jgi:glutathione S-transferase
MKRYHDETLRLYGVLEIQLSGKYTGVKKKYLAGKGEGKYSWADMAIWS